MTIDERTRHDLFVKLEGILGADDANTLMEHLPPVGWADVATKRDLDNLETRVDARFDAFEYRLKHHLEERLGAQQRTHFFSTLGIVMTVIGMAFVR
jgi:hypothetical protein